MIEIFAFLPLVLALFTCNYVPKAFQYASLFWIPSCVIIAVFALFNNEGGGLSYILKRKLIVLAGAFSFTFYMIHQMLIIFTNSLLENFGITLSLWEKLPLVLTCTIALSYIIYRFIEIPTTKILKEYIR